MQPDATALVQPSLSPECEILREFAQLVGPQTYNHWFRETASIGVAGQRVTVGVPNGFLLSWMQNKFRAQVIEAARRVLGESIEVRFALRTNALNSEALHTGSLQPDAPGPGALEPSPLERSAETTNSRELSRDTESSGLDKSASTAQSPDAHPSPAADSSSRADQSPRADESVDAVVALVANETVGASGHLIRQPEPNPEPAFPLARAQTKPQPTFPSAKSPSSRSTSQLPNRGRVRSGPAPAELSLASVAGPAVPSASRRYADLADFVKGPSNELALTAALHVCEQPGFRYNPLVLYGGVGTGKTHLLEGMHRRLRARHPTLNVLFLSAETFANCFTQALRDRSLPSFRQRFRTVDVLMIDDVDFLDGKRVIQEEFLHTIKQLESHGRQIMLCADRHPRLLTKLSEELVTRFIAGIVCRIECPDVDTRRTIVGRKAAKLAVTISPEAQEFVVQRFGTSVRELEGAMNCLETYAIMSGKSVGLSTARHVLADLHRDCVRIVRLADVEQTVCRFFGIESQELRSSRRSRSVSQPRMLAMFLARKMTQAAYSEIGEYFGGRNHSTVMSAEKRVRELVASEATVRVSTYNWKWGELMSSLEQQVLAG